MGFQATMSEAEIAQRAGLAVAIGLLIGVERGWQQRQERDGSRVAGIRTYTLIGALGGLCGFLARVSALSILGYCFLGFALPFGFFEWQHMRATRNFSATNLVAGLLTFVLGAYAVLGDMAVAAAASVVAAAILAERQYMHAFVRHLKWIELRAALLLMIMTAVLLPALPDRTVDPWGALNPHQMWLMTVLIGAVCYAGYIAVRLAGERRGLLYAGIMGGLATSTTVTWTFARLGRNSPAALPKIMAAILAAWIVSLIRMTAIAVVIAPVLAAPLLPPVAAAAVIFCHCRLRISGRRPYAGPCPDAAGPLRIVSHAALSGGAGGDHVAGEMAILASRSVGPVYSGGCFRALGC